jgi:hypothetical protein
VCRFAGPDAGTRFQSCAAGQRHARIV